jgi:small-conductance mechanosensitive channel
MNGTIDLERLAAAGQALLRSAFERMLSVEFLIELLALVISGLLAQFIAPHLIGYFKRHIVWSPRGLSVDRAAAAASSVAIPILWLVFLRLAIEIGRAGGLPMNVAASASALLVAWIAIRLLSNVVRNPFWSRIIFVTAWTLAALEIVGLLDRIEASLASIGFTYGDVQISALNIVRALVVLVVLLCVAAWLRGLLERRILLAQNLTPTLRVLFVQALRLALPAVAVLVALPVLGINLTALTVLGGALAVGAGLGLQRVVSNVVSGVLLLGSGSIRPGDVIAVKDMSGAEAYGRVTAISANYLSLETRGGKEHLIPNETFLTNGVENWTHSDSRVRLKIPFRTTYDCEPKVAVALALEAAAATSRVIKEPRPVCHLSAFGEATIEYELRIWIEDPMNGVANVKSDCLLQLWDRFQANGIRIVAGHLEVVLASPDGKPVAAKPLASRRA